MCITSQENTRFIIAWKISLALTCLQNSSYPPSFDQISFFRRIWLSDFQQSADFSSFSMYWRLHLHLATAACSARAGTSSYTWWLFIQPTHACSLHEHHGAGWDVGTLSPHCQQHSWYSGPGCPPWLVILPWSHWCLPWLSALSVCIKTSLTLIAPDLGWQCSPLPCEAHGESSHAGSNSKPHPLPILPGSLLYWLQAVPRAAGRQRHL